MNASLAGLLVADLTQNVAGRCCPAILGDLGAEVVKVERPTRGDDSRAWAPPYWGEESAAFMSVLGEHTAEVLAERGYDEHTIAELAERHVIGL